MSIKKYCEMTAFPLTDVMQLKRNILPLAISHGNGFWWNFGYIYPKEAYACIFREKHVWHGWYKQALTSVAAVSFSGHIRA